MAMNYNSVEIPKVSIIVPVYNTEKYLERCLESINKQTLSDYEVLIVNDESTDDSEEKCRLFIADKPKFRIINKQHGGLTSARLCGWKEAAGKYVVFVDSDDFVEPDYCKALYEACETTNSPLAICSYREVTDNGISSIINLPFETSVITNIQDDYIKPLIAGESKISKIFPVALWLRMMLRERITEDCFINENKVFSEDRVFNMIFAQHIEKIALVQRPLYNYYQRFGSLMHSYRSNKWKMYKNLYEICSQYCEKNRIGNMSHYLSTLLLGSAWHTTRNAAFYLNYSDFKVEYQSIRCDNSIHEIFRSIGLFSDEFRLLIINQKIIYIMLRFLHPRIAYHFYKWRTSRHSKMWIQKNK